MERVTTIGMVGLGKMGANMMERLRSNGIEVIGYDLSPELRDVDSLEALMASMPSGRRVVWLMMSMPGYQPTLDALSGLLEPGDMIVDGGNTKWQITQERHERFAGLDVHYVDVGTSGGIYGLTEGYAVMVGGTDEEFEALLPVLRALAPDENGLVHAGPSGAGHFVKEVHNGAEYAVMSALGEIYALMAAMPQPDDPSQKLVTDPVAVLASWRDGSIVKSFLLNMAVQALEDQEAFAKVAPVANDSGEGRWTLHDALDVGVPTPTISAAMNARFASQGGADDASRLVAALRNQFGGHPVVPV